MKDLEEKYAHLARMLAGAGSVGIAFSGGVDSTLLLDTACRHLGDDRVLALTAATVLQSEADINNARALACRIGCEHILVDTEPLLENYICDNSTMRCYYCKKKTYEHFLALLARRGIATLLDGTNADDGLMDRPGLRAVDELGVQSPLWLAGLRKEEVRALARRAGLPNWDRPSSSCFATRIAAGTRITEQRLVIVARLETFLDDHGITGCRARLHDDTVVVEFPEASMVFFVSWLRPDFFLLCRELGFSRVLLDLQPRPASTLTS